MSTRRSILAVLLTAAALLFGGCTVLSEFGQLQCNADSGCRAGTDYGECQQGFCAVATCESITDCTERGDAFAAAVCIGGICRDAECAGDDECEGADICVDGACIEQEEARWGCVDERAPQGVVDGTTVTYRTLVKELNGTMGIPARPEMQAIACQVPTCDQPVGPFSPDAEGYFDIEVNRGFQGIIKFSAPGLLDTILDLKVPVNEDIVTDIVRVFPQALATTLAALTGVTPDLETKGLLFVNVYDCLGGRAEGVKLTLTGQTDEEVFYVDGNNVPATALTSTDPAGVAGVVNVPPGQPLIDLSREATGTPLRSYTVTVFANTVTYAPFQVGR